MKKFIIFLVILLPTQPLFNMQMSKTRHHVNAGCVVIGTIIFLSCAGGAIATLLEYKIDTKLVKAPLLSIKPNKRLATKLFVYFSFGALIGTGTCIYGLGNILSDMLRTPAV